ncbi:MAG: hypothetical protein J1F01_08180 [Oscillospiraceae bacterium]|nr:hypothetical protein [Oscillospiraceae bacterium]
MKKIISAIISLAMIASMFTALPVYADDENTNPDETQKYVEPESPSVTYNMNVDWKFKQATVHSTLTNAINSVKDDAGNPFYSTEYDDSEWENVSVPHPINASDSFDYKCHDDGDGIWRGFMFYRKRVIIPESDAGKKLFLEFEAIRNSVYLYVNGEMVGYYEAGVAATGFDITDKIKVGEENIIAVATDNGDSRGQTDKTNITVETRPGTEPGSRSGSGYQWNTKDFNEVQGGITGNVNLYAKDKVYQTLPLYNNLKTTGNYIYGSDFDIDAKSATINVEAEIRNETDEDKDLTLQVDIVGMDGKLAHSFEKSGKAEKATDADAHFMNMVPDNAYDENGVGQENNNVDISTVQVSYINASDKMENMRFWSDKDPYLYTVYTILKDGDDIIDVQKTVTGFRKVEYDINNGLRINDQYVYLKGYAQRATDEWAVIGVANDWLNDIDMQLIKESNGNHIRWMHVAPKPVTVRSSDKYGVLVTCPAGDKESDVTGREWDQRVETMRDVMIYFRNSPSVLFWEAGNQAITPAHMKEMTDLKNALDPDGGRFSGSRTISSVDQIKEAEYVGTMENRNASDAKTSMTAANGKYMPIMETEYARDEAPRRVWDDFSPPDYDYRNKWLGPDGKKDDNYDIWDQTSEDFAVGNARQYNQFWAGRVTGGGSELYTGAAIMVWSDSNMHTRNCWSENCRTSGKVDAVRIKKEAFYALQAAQSDEPKIHIVGHWNYPEYKEGDENGNYWYEDSTWDGTSWNLNGNMIQRGSAADKANADVNAKNAKDKGKDNGGKKPTEKTVFVIGSPGISKVELYINDEKVGENYKPEANFVYKFTEVDVTQSGEIKAIAYDDSELPVAEDSIATVGEPDHIELEPVTGPAGLVADGSDVMYFDVKVVDKDGNVCPLNYDRLDLEVSGNGVLLGGYNSGEGESVKNYGWSELNEIHNNFVFAECGVNRVFIKSTRNAGDITLKITHAGLGAFESTIKSIEFDNTVEGGDGLSTQMQRDYPNGEKPPVVPKKVEAFKPLAAPVKADFSENGNTKIVEEIDDTVYYTVTVNGEDLNLDGELRAREGTGGSGVFGPICPVLEELKTAGVIDNYSIDGSPKLLTFVADGHTYTIKEGENAIHRDDDDDANGTEITETTKVIGGELFVNLTAVLGWIPGVTVSKDTENHVYTITTTKAAAALLDDEFELSSVSSDNIELMEIDPKYEEQTYFDDFDTEPMADGPNGTGYISPTSSTNIISANKAEVGRLLLSDSILSFDFRIDNETPNMLMEMKSGGSLGPSFYLSGGQLLNETKSNTTEKLGAVTVGKWYHFEMEGTVGTGASPIAARLYLYDDNGSLTPVQEGSIALRNIYNKALDAINVQPGMSIANLKIISIYADEVAVSALKDEINANETLALSAKATRGGKDVVTPTFTWTLLDENGESLDNEEVSIDENGTLTAGVLAPNMTVTVRATAGSLGNPYGEKKIVIHGLDTSKDTFDEITASCDTDSVRTGESVTITTERKMKGEVVEDDEPTGENIAVITPDVDVADAQLIFAVYNSAGALEQVKLGEEKFSAEAGESVSVNIPFDIGTDVKIMLWKSLESMEPVNVVIDSATDTSGIVWKIYNADKTREFTNVGIKINKGVVTVDEDVVPQTINVRASNISGSTQAWVTLNIKPGNMLLDGEMGNKDTFISGNACEDIVPDVTIKDGSWDGSGYYEVTSGALPFTGFANNTSEHVIYAADMKFNEDFAGWTIWNSSNGKQGLQIILRDKDSRLGIVKGSNYSSDPYCMLEKNVWYHIEIMCSTGLSANSYANLIVYKYDSEGRRVNPETGVLNVPYVALGIGMRNLSADSANHIEINPGTSVDNVWCAKIAPDEIAVSVEKDTLFAGQATQGNVTAKRKDVPFGYISSDLIKWIVYDENNETPLGSELIKVDASGKLTVDALAEAQTVYLRAQTYDGSLYDSVKIAIQSSDIFTVHTIGFNEGYEKVVQLNVTKNFSYSDDVTFVVAVYDSEETTLKSMTTRKMSAKNIERSDEPVAISMAAPMPEGFDKDSDVVYIYTMTSNSENEAVTEDDGTIKAAFSGDTLTFADVPTFDASRPVIVMVVKPDTVTTSVKDEDIVYIKQFTGTNLATDLTSIKVEGETGDYIIKMAGKVDGMSVINTGIVTKQ